MTYRGLDLFCKQGGATRGYQLAGFEMTGVDIEPQPRYIGEHFVQADALEYLRTADLSEFAFIHASPPCQDKSSLHALQPTLEYPQLIPQTREALLAAGLPYIIENVGGARSLLREPILLCGTMFGYPTKRHRLFELAGFTALGMRCSHKEYPVRWTIRQHFAEQQTRFVYAYGHQERGQTIADWREALGIDWMDRDGMSQAIIPAMTRFIGTALLAQLTPRPNAVLDGGSGA